MEPKTNERNNSNIILYILGILMCIAPCFRGLFFQKEMYIVSIVFAFIGILFISINLKDENKIKVFSPIQLFATIFVSLYIVMFFFSYNKELALFETVKNSTYFIIFMMTTYLIKDYKNLKFINTIFILSGVVTVIIGFLTAFGNYEYKGAFEAGMMNSVFQYHNTFGAYMVATLLLCVSEITDSCKSKKYILSSSAYILFVGLIISYSRGAWLILPVSGFIALLLLRKEAFKNVILVFVNVIISFAITFNGIYKSAAQTASKGWIFILVGILITYGLTVLSDKLFSERDFNKKHIIISMVSLAILIALGLGTGMLTKYLPSSVADRITSINLKTFTVVERNVFYKDGLKIVKENPFTGVGGGGWQSLYNKYKTYQYSTTQSHNYIMQVWIEIGTFGLIAYLGMILSFIYVVIRLLKKIDHDNIYNRFVGILCAIVALIAHSAIDFDMALGAYAIMLWTMLGVVVYIEKTYLFIDKKKNIIFSLPKYTVLLLSVLVILSSSSYKLSNFYALKGIDLSNSGDYESVQKYFKKASLLGPYKASYKIDLANIDLLLAKKNKSKELFEKSRENADKAFELGKTDFKMIKNAMVYYFKIGDVDSAIKASELLKTYNPIDDGTYDELIDINYATASNYLSQQKIEEAIKYFNNILVLESEVNEINKRLEKEKNTLLEGVEDIPKSYVKDRFKVDLSERSETAIQKSKTFLGK